MNEEKSAVLRQSMESLNVSSLAHAELVARDIVANIRAQIVVRASGHPLPEPVTTERSFEYVYREFWTCRNPTHRHSLQERAQECIARSQLGPRRLWTDDKVLEAISRRKAGETFKSIGKSFFVTGNRVSQVIAAYERRQRRKAWLAGEKNHDAP